MGSKLARGSVLFALLATPLFLALCSSATAVSPEAIMQGKLLFEKNWSPRNPQLGNDGLGPMFNGRSCATCHNQGAVGGGGDATFNAKTLGIDRMRIVRGEVTKDVVRQAISNFHPGFVSSTGDVMNTAAIPHHGGSQQYKGVREALLKSIPAVFSENGGPVSAAEVRYANATPIMYSTNQDGRKVTISARLYQRNTPAIFGAGLIDQVSYKTIKAIQLEQKKHPEISGRPATLSSGRIGRFGWRGNVPSLLDFCDEACANELGLETERMPQMTDPTARNYQNPSHDISDSNIKLMTAFMRALPAPTRMMPDDSQRREQVIRGEQVFASVGCAVCHVPNVGPAKGLYSDLLLHDMGYESQDLNRAEPYIKRVTNVSKLFVSGGTVTESSTMRSTGYYGGGEEITSSVRPLEESNSSGRKRRFQLRRTDYVFEVPVSPLPMIIVPRGVKSTGKTLTKTETKTSNATIEFTRGTQFQTRTRTLTTKKDLSTDNYTRIHHEVTKFNQEWRTPPLWGVRDSSPYMHDGRAETLLEAITMHEGEAAKTRDRFLMLPVADRRALIEFLNTMVAPQMNGNPKLASKK